MIVKQDYRAIKMIWNPDRYQIDFEEEKKKAIRGCIEEIVENARQDGVVLDTFPQIEEAAKITISNATSSMLKILVEAKVTLYV